MANLDSSSLKQFSNELFKNLEVKEQVYSNRLKEQQKEFTDKLNKSNISDKKIVKLLDESSKSDGDYKKAIEKLTTDYIKEQKKNNKLNTKDSEAIENLLKEMSKSNKKAEELAEITKSINRKEELANPLNAFSHAIDDFKKTYKEQGLKKGAGEGAKTLGSGLLESTKQQFTLKNMSKALLHGAGLFSDSPALNILASTIESDVKSRSDDLSKSQDLIDELSKIDADSTDSEKVFEENTKNNEELLKSQKELLNEYKNSGSKDSLDKLLESIYEDHGSVLENILAENKDTNSYFKEFLFMQKDLADDSKSKSKESKKISEEPGFVEPEDGTSLMDLLGDSGIGGRRSKIGKGISKAGSLLKTGAMFAGGGLLAGGLGLAIGEGINKALGQKTLTATIDEKGLANTLSDAWEGLKSTVGLSDESKTSKSKQQDSKLFGAKVKEGSEFLDKMEDKGIVDTSFFGKDEIKDIKEVENLSLNEITALINSGDWSTDTFMKLNKVYMDKLKKVSTMKKDIEANKDFIPNYSSGISANTDNGVNLMKDTSVSMSTPIPNEKPAPLQVQQNTNSSKGSSTVVVPVKEGPAMIDKYSLEDRDVMVTLQKSGMRA